MPVFHCNCGDKFTKARDLRVHIGLLNPRWPRKSPDDSHWEISKAEYLHRQYLILNDKINPISRTTP
jgi:hypothetical protein